MDEEVDTLVIGVHADMTSFSKDIADMRGALDGPLVNSADRAGKAIESGLLRAVRSGKLGFEDFGRTAMSVLSQIAASAVRDGLGALGLGSSGTSSGGNGLVQLASSLLGSALGLPGRATGGPVAPGQAYLVGERGPELFLPTSSGQVVPGGQAGGGARNVQVSITVNGQGQNAPQALARSARQVARAVRGALSD